MNTVFWFAKSYFQSHEAPVLGMQNEDYDSAGNYIGGANSDIFERINAMLDNTLDLANIAPLSTEQNTRKLVNTWAASWENRIFAYAKTKAQISFAVTAKLISAFVFATRIVHFLFFLYPKFQASSLLLWLYSPVCVGPGRKPGRPVFSRRGSHVVGTVYIKMMRT